MNKTDPRGKTIALLLAALALGQAGKGAGSGTAGSAAAASSGLAAAVGTGSAGSAAGWVSAAGSAAAGSATVLYTLLAACGLWLAFSLLSGRSPLQALKKTSRFWWLAALAGSAPFWQIEGQTEWAVLIIGGSLPAAARIYLLLLFADWFAAATSPRQFQEAVTWFLRPVPGIREKEAALMLRLVLTRIPEAFRLRNLLQDARQVRGWPERRRIGERIRLTTWPLVRSMILASYQQGQALQARAWNPAHYSLDLALHPRDLFVILAAAAPLSVQIIPGLF